MECRVSSPAISNTAIAKYGDRNRWAARWSSLKGKLDRVVEEGREIASKALQAGGGFATFGALYYWRRRRELAGKRVTFDEAGKVDGFFWPGLAIAAAGVTPLLGDAGKYVVPLGVAAMCCGSVGMIDKLAVEHHAKA